MIRHDSDPAFVRHCILECLERTLRNPRIEGFFLGLKAGRMDALSATTEPDNDDVTITHTVYPLRFWVPMERFKSSEEERFSELINYAFQKMHEDSNVKARVWFKVIPTLVPATESGLNNASFKVESTIAHDELRFRSRSEIAIYDVFKSRDVLFFPNAAAILGRHSPEAFEKREPDFLVCHKGKWGILEVSGEPWHSGAISTAKDHDRSRLFQHYGLVCVQHFDANRCRHSPADVVDEFLLLLAKS
ncbi:hypothetical protein VT84_06925 [Gemmata sp. SH-PL17]|uniref:hypothetical protein n=1 Tax=Gemmata sp. SH-PL17 TaxID=1630693 RepID=UPI00078D2BCF|nr:hypothetical protein [Gemmata sp. SH-PL17]AMV24112.1 hypothetical protein VT84_06925 [Gemmata sp. SH-PL17]